MEVKALVPIIVATLMVASSAEAVVLCAKPRSDGTFSTSVKVREACKAGETQLDAAQIGAQGPQGPVGPSEAWVGETAGRMPMFLGNQQLASIDVPPGEYTVQTFVRFIADPGVAEASVSCELIASPIGEIDVSGWSPITNAPFQQFDMPLLGWARLPGGGTIVLECDAFSSDPLELRLGYNPSPLVATRVGAVLPLPPPPGD